MAVAKWLSVGIEIANRNGAFAVHRADLHGHFTAGGTPIEPLAVPEAQYNGLAGGLGEAQDEPGLLCGDWLCHGSLPTWWLARSIGSLRSLPRSGKLLLNQGNTTARGLLANIF